VSDPEPGHEQVVLRGRVFRVVAFEVTDARGRPHAYQVVRHAGAAAIVPWCDDGRVLLIRQLRPSIGRPLLEIPAGTLDPAEDAETCARRELEEETGFTAAEWRRLAAFWPSPGILDERMWVFEARGLAPGTADPDDDEEIENIPVDPAEVPGLVAAGEIADAKTLIGLQLAGIPVGVPGW
jgi:ADP-ribose pyrophosphatase